MGDLPHKADANADQSVIYRVVLGHGRFDVEILKRFQKAATFEIERTNRKGKLKIIDLKAMVQHIHLVKPDTLELVIHHQPGALIRPDRVLQFVFGYPLETIRRARVIKLGYRTNLPGRQARSGSGTGKRALGVLSWNLKVSPEVSMSVPRVPTWLHCLPMGPSRS